MLLARSCMQTARPGVARVTVILNRASVFCASAEAAECGAWVRTNRVNERAERPTERRERERERRR